MLDALCEDMRVIIVHKKLVRSLELSCCGVLIKTRPSCCSKTTRGNSQSVISLISQTEGMWFSVQVSYINVLLPAVKQSTEREIK